MDILKRFRDGGGDKKSGSSSTTREVSQAELDAKAAQGKIYVAEFVNKVEALASGNVTGDEHIEALAGMVGKVVFMVTYGSGDYWVGLKDYNNVRFMTQQALVNDPKYRIPRALVVPSTLSNNLVITTAKEENKTKLESFKFKPETYEELDLTMTVSPARCWFILTTQLSGCTFAAGCLGTVLYMGHAQRCKDVGFAGDGEQVASSLKEKRKTMFQNVGNLESTFLVSFGKKFKIDKSESDRHCIITYTFHADVIGVACNKNIYFIVSIRSDTDKVDKVVLVTQETGTKKWKTKEMKKTW